MAEKEEEKHGEGEVAEGGKSKKPLIIIIAVIVVLIIVGAVVAVMMMKSGDEEATAGDGNATHKEGDKKQEKKKEKGGEEGKAGPMLMIDNIVVNLISETGARYTKISLAIELNAPEVMLEATEKKPIIQDIVISVISQKTADELVTYKGKEACKNDILDRVNKILHDGTAKNVYFTNFIVQ
jgi:flagellar FliL protein